MSTPIRIQRKRSKGWKMPENTVYVGRPTWFGNPFTPENYFDSGYSGKVEIAIQACVRAYREWLTQTPFTLEWRSPVHLAGWLMATRQGRIDRLSELRGKNLACWCPLEDKDGNPVPCHADVLLELANERGGHPDGG